MGERVVDPSGIRTVIPDAEQAALDWIARTGIQPINHVFAVRNSVADANPWLPAELYELFDRARAIAVAEGAAEPPPYGLEASRASLQLCNRFSAEQRITPHEIPVDEMFWPL
jgi:4,5-dihydroxyphthalate decarboxylase